MKTNVTAIVPAAGLGKRFGKDKNKPFFNLLGKPLLLWVFETLQSCDEISEIIPVLKEDDIDDCLDLLEKCRIPKVKQITAGGKERQDSVYNGLKCVRDKTGAVLIHDGARPLIDIETILRTINGLSGSDAAIAAVPVKDTIKAVRSRESGVNSQEFYNELFVDKTLDRNILWSVQTPQVFIFDKIMDAHERAQKERFYATDDAALIEHYGGVVKIVMGDYSNIKITTPEDIKIAEAISEEGDIMRIGIGYDSHRLIEDWPLIIGGVEVPFEKGLAGHSDADVLCHAIIDAILGAAGLGDIGSHFPDTDPRWKGASSIMLLNNVVDMAKQKGFGIVNIDCTVITEKPKIAPHISAMKDSISEAGIPHDLINIKAKTNEGMGFIGRGEGIAAQAICLLRNLFP
jgi:2-C-methyl-D-erythritol 4-phosphate cytidylyltransferase/2-C-methyl-D-erythritol 2,4-cyclodiphosphate synthase